MGDEWFVDVFTRPGQPMKEFRKLVDAVAVRSPEMQADAEKILADAQRLLGQRHRVVHSAVMNERDPDSHFYEAWHAKSNIMWPVVPADLNSLAYDLARCAREVDAFGAAWEERALNATASPT